MDGSIVLGSSQRKRLLDIYRGKEDCSANVRLRAHIVLLLSEGQPWSLITAVLFCSTATISRWKDRFESGGVEALLEENRGRAGGLLAGWGWLLVFWVKSLTPRGFGYFRSRWCCATLALVLFDLHGIKASAETVRRCLHKENLVWRRPRPVPGPVDPQRDWKLRQVRELLKYLPEDEAAVFQDEVDLNLNPEIGSMWMEKGEQAEVDLNLNPEIGSMWMEKGEQAEVVTPGTNVKRYLAGSMSWRSGELVVTQGTSRNAELFVRHLEDLRQSFRRYKKIHVICDNARFHTEAGSLLVREYLEKHGDRIVLHYLPSYSPQHNPIERVWWHLREEITRNHRCRDIGELVRLTMNWIEDRGAFEIQGAMYQRIKALL